MNELWEIVCFGDNDYYGDLVSKGSISGFIFYVPGVVVSWQSKAQKSVIFLAQRQSGSLIWGCKGGNVSGATTPWSMKISDNLPVMVRVDNVGSILMVSNITNMSFSNNVDIRYKYLNGYHFCWVCWKWQQHSQKCKGWAAWEALKENGRWEAWRCF